MPRVQQLQVVVGGGTQVTGEAEGSVTRVTGIRVGKPVRRISATQPSNVDQIVGIDASGKVDGATFVYNESSGNFEATKDLDKQNINGGQY